METFFRITGLLCREFAGHRWIPRTKASDSELWCFISSAPESTVEQTMETPVIWDAHYDVTIMSDSYRDFVYNLSFPLSYNTFHLGTADALYCTITDLKWIYFILDGTLPALHASQSVLSTRMRWRTWSKPSQWAASSTTLTETSRSSNSHSQSCTCPRSRPSVYPAVAFHCRTVITAIPLVGVPPHVSQF